jgi:two-component system cell cycle sensor histidine kinase/response regulator CckA
MNVVAQRDRWLSIARGSLGVGTVALLLEVVSQAGFSVPQVEAFLVLVVAYVAFVDGIAAGVAGALVAVVYFAYATFPPGKVFHFAVFDWEHVVIVGVAFPVLAFIVGHLRSQLDETREREELTRVELDTVLENLSAGFYTLDQHGTIEYVNPRTAEILGESREELVGRQVREVEPRPPGAEADGGIERALASRESSHYELKDESERIWYDVQVDPLPAGRGVAVYFTDVTERKRMLDRAYGAVKMEALGRLAGGIAHDFNNLLTAIQGFNDLVLRDLEPSDTRRASLEQVAQAASRAARLTRQILAYAKRQVLQPEVLDLNRLIADMAAMLRRLVRSDVAIETDLDDDLFPVRVDAGQFEQIVLNLAINASDAMPHGGRLTIRTRHARLEHPEPSGRFTMEPGEYAVVSVEDTGVGMDDGTMERIFEPFFTTKDRAQGTGLGLSTVYGIVKQSGGYIHVDSAPGAGSRFKVWLPCAEGEAASEEPEEVTSPQPAGRATVLVVEDDEAVRALSTRLLRDHGYTVLEASDGMRALQIAGMNLDTIDLLFTDIVLPGLSGREVARRLLTSRPDLKVLYTSGFTNDNLIQGGIARGVLEAGIAFLHKPFTAADLLMRVDDLLREPVGC